MAAPVRPLDVLARTGDVVWLIARRCDGTRSSQLLTVAGVEPGVFWFLVDRSDRWVTEIATRPHVVVAVEDRRTGSWVSSNGVARLVADASISDRLWHPSAAAHFSGPLDPRLATLRVDVGEDSPGER